MLFCLSMLSCDNAGNKISKPDLPEEQIELGNWKFSFLSQKHEIPIRAKFENNRFLFLNAEEEVELSYTIKGDSIFIPIPNFDSHIEGLIQSPTQIKGAFIKDYVEDYSIQFIAEKSNENVFGKPSGTSSTLKQKYKTEFYFDDRISPAIGLFKQNGNIITGSFAKETGDYRFLEGVVNGSKLELSTFDGTHLYLFTADIKGDSLTNGKFISGKGGNYTWSAIYSEDVGLRNPEELTTLKDGYSTFYFSALDLSNELVKLEEERFNAKLKIIQVTGTWCPNCLDETRFFTELYEKYRDDGLEIIGLAFENGSDTLKILEKLERYKLNNNIEYPLLYAGKAGSANASNAFPMINKIMSFPTAIYLNEQNEVLKIYTGFYGPGTGEYYHEYVSHTQAYIESILN